MRHRHRHTTSTARLGKWLPAQHVSLAKWLKKTLEAAEKKKMPFHPVIKDFQTLIETDPIIHMYFTQMFDEQPAFEPPAGSGDIKLKNHRQMLVVLNHILTTAPEFDTTEMVGCPINAILDFPMITLTGFAAFTNDKVNDMIRRVLTVWKTFLDSKESRYVLNKSSTGWLSSKAQKVLKLDEFQTDPDAPYLGFKSWNDFFIRRFKSRRRPAARVNDPKAITSPCEASPFAIEINVQSVNTFWVKSQPYSLRQLLDGNHVDTFVGGTVYQAFLSAGNYHRWHSPVSGTIKKFANVPGTYYSEAPSEGFDPGGPKNSQGYIAHVATRALLFIEADDPDIGLVCLVLVGMAEVSSCVFVDVHGESLKAGQKLKKGDQVGYFQFGGSTYCLVFRPGVISEFALDAIPQGDKGSNSTLVKVNSLLAIAN